MNCPVTLLPQIPHTILIRIQVLQLIIFLNLCSMMWNCPVVIRIQHSSLKIQMMIQICMFKEEALQRELYLAQKS
jgi:hypothetical protein